MLWGKTRHYTPLAVLSDSNDTTCVNAASVDPSMEHLILHFPWPGWDWSIVSTHSTEISFRLVMDIGLECEPDYSELPWYEQLKEISLAPEVQVYTTDKSHDPLPDDPSTDTFHRCRVYQKETEGDDVRICFFKCTCPSTQCHAALVYVPDKTLEMCEFSLVP